MNRWPALIKFTVFSLLFFFVEYALQFYWLSPGDSKLSIIRAGAYSGLTFISAALLLSSIFRWKPLLAQYWHIRRYFGVAGVVFVTLHILGVYYYYFGGDFQKYLQGFQILNPIMNPLVFGAVAFPILFVMALLSNDYSVRKLGIWWKRIQQLVYIAFIASIYHALLTGAMFLKTPPAVLMLALTFLAVAGELYWFVKTVRIRGLRRFGSMFGILLIAASIVIAYLAYA